MAIDLPDPPSHVRRIAFIGTPEAAVPVLRALVEAGFEVPIVVTGPDRRRGRGGEVSFTPVKHFAVDHGIEVSSSVEDVLDHDVDLGVVVAFGRIIGVDILAQVPMVNLHFSRLPRWRGAAPVERAILAGDTETAVVVMQVVEALDEGDVFAEHEVDIEADESAAELRGRLARLGADLMVETIRAGFPARRPQEGETVYAAKITSEDRLLDWALPATQLARMVRVGGAWTTFRGRRFKVHDAVVAGEILPPGEIRHGRVGTGAGSLELRVVQPEGKPRMDVTAWANGARPDGERFESPPDE